MHTRTIWTIALTSLFLNLQAQSFQAIYRKAEHAFQDHDYKAALSLADSALEKDSLSVAALYLAGESALQLQEYNRATKYLLAIPESSKIGDFTKTDYSLGFAKMRRGQYLEAIPFFKRYLDAHRSEDAAVTQLTLANLENCHWAIRSLEDPIYASVATANSRLNTPFSEFAPLRYGDRLYFSSGYQDEKSSTPVSRIYHAILDNPPALFAKNPKNNVNASHIALMPDASMMYFTICQDDLYFQQKECEIWRMEKTYEGEWASPRKLPAEVNLPKYTATQPTVGWDNLLKKYVLYFVSDRPGGTGQLDIWASTIEPDGAFGKPVPLPINTPQNDITPYFHQLSQTLFFSSNGWPGLGGFDVFRCEKTGLNTWSAPENMGAPINTSADELYYSWNAGAQRGYLSSNRHFKDCPGAAQGDFCSEIFEAQVFALLLIKAYETGTNRPIEISPSHVVVNNGSFFEPDPLTYGPGKEGILLDVGKTYELTISVPGYFPQQMEVNTGLLTKSTHLEHKVVLLPNGENRVVKP